MAVEHWKIEEIRARLDLRSRDDQASVQYFSTRDPKFWLRLLLPVISSVDVTDLLAGAFSEADQADALYVALADNDCTRTPGIVFRDISPLGASKDVQRTRLVHVVELYASGHGRFIQNWDERQDEMGKTDLMVELR